MSAGLPTGAEIAERYRRRRDAADDLYEAVELFVAAGNMSAFSADANKALAAAHDKATAALSKARGQ